jgi:drug/metabolite transporter (DMT)-like permease
MLLGGLGVCGFSLTLPMTRLAVAELDPVFVGLGRALLAAVLAGGALAWKRERFPARKYWASLFVVGGGVIVGFPLFSALAMREVPAAHGAIVTALLPLATALAAVWRAHERPSFWFWLAAGLGSSTVVGFIYAEHGLALRRADLFLLIAVATCAVGYAEGGRLSRELGGWRVIAWALVFAAPLLVIPVARSTGGMAHAGWLSWAAFSYLGLISMFVAFCAWYSGLALGGVARVSQIQLLQPFLTILASAILLHEQVTPGTFLVAFIVVAAVAAARRVPIIRPA